MLREGIAVTTSQPNVPYGSAPQFTLVVGELRVAWPVLMLRGFLALLFGALALLWPGITVLALAILFGAYALVDGVGLLIDAVRHKDRPHRALDVVAGIAGIGAGIIAFIWPAITALALAMLIGAWALVTGVAEIVAAVTAAQADRRRVDHHRGRRSLGHRRCAAADPAGHRRLRDRTHDRRVRDRGRRDDDLPRVPAPEGRPRRRDRAGCRWAHHRHEVRQGHRAPVT